jgi:uncharacterized protein
MIPPGLAYPAAAGAGLLAGAINAVAGGGTLISFPVLQGLGLPAVRANITNIVALTPGYVSGTHAQRSDLAGQRRRLRSLVPVAAAGGLLGSILLVVVSAATFKRVVPFLILVACAALLGQNRLRAITNRNKSASTHATDTTAARSCSTHENDEPTARAVEKVSIFGCAVYGGFFGAGLGIMLLGVLGLFSDSGLIRANAVKQALSIVIGVIAAAFLAFSRHVEWTYAAIVAVASTLGGTLGGRFVSAVNPVVLRIGVVLLGCAVAVRYWV